MQLIPRNFPPNPFENSLRLTIGRPEQGLQINLGLSVKSYSNVDLQES